MIQVLLAGYLSALALMTIVWVLSLVYRDASLVDRVWGLSFVVLNVVYFLHVPDPGIRHLVLLTLVAIWGLRLSAYITWRNRGHGEDYRYVAMRKEHGKRFWWYSFFSVFVLQGTLAFIIAAPLYWVNHFPSPAELNIVDYTAIGMWLTGFAFEAGGDWQLARFKQNPENRGKLLTTGFWSVTRHPNYFGDGLQWWAYFFFALSLPWGWVTFFGPLIMSVFLRYVSGVALLEKGLKKSKPGYEEYVAEVPAFIPTPGSLIRALRR